MSREYRGHIAEHRGECRGEIAGISRNIAGCSKLPLLLSFASLSHLVLPFASKDVHTHIFDRIPFKLSGSVVKLREICETKTPQRFAGHFC